MIKCPFCNIRMYEVIDEDYPSLEVYFCYECGFQADTILMTQKTSYQLYQQLFIHSKDKGLTSLIPKKIPKLKIKNISTENQQRNKTPDDETEPKNAINVQI